MVASYRDRAQLILIGSLAIAVVLIGLTILLNSVIFTENVAESDAIQVTGDVDEFLTETRHSTQDLALRVNHAQEYDSLSQLEGNMQRNFTNYSRVLGETHADTGSVYVNVTYDGAPSVGRRVAQTSDGEFEKNGSDTWSVYGAGSKYVGWFAMNVDVDNVSESQHFALRVTNESGSTLAITMKQSGGDLLVNSTIDGNHVSNTSCVPADTRVYVDVLGGQALTGSCSFNTTDFLAQPYTDIRFVNGSAAYGQYAIVVNNDDNLEVASCPVADEPCQAPAIWEATISMKYETGDVAYHSTQDVNIYREGGTTADANDVVFVTAATPAPPDDAAVKFTLENTGTSPVYVTEITVNSTSTTADWVSRVGIGNELTTNRSGGDLDQDIEIGGSFYSLDTDAHIPASGQTEFTLRAFQNSPLTPPPDRVSMSGEQVTLTVTFVDGTQKTFTFTT